MIRFNSPKISFKDIRTFLLSIINERKSFFLSLVSSLFIATEITSDFIFCLSNSFSDSAALKNDIVPYLQI